MGYFRLSQIIVKNSVSRFTQYRGNVLTYIFVSILWIGLRFIFIDTIFSYTNVLGGWTKEMVWALVLLFPLIDSFANALFGTVAWGIHDTIVSGGLDGTLVKPKSPLFLSWFSQFNLQPCITGMLQLAVFIWALLQASPNISFFQVLIGLFMSVGAVSVQFSVCLLIGCIGFWFPRTENLLDAWNEILGVASYPLTVLPNTLYQIFLTIIPVALVAFIPASAFLGVLSWQLSGIAILVTSAFLLGSVSLWRIAIKRYSSASS